jgi:hypothetical protein
MLQCEPDNLQQFLQHIMSGIKSSLGQFINSIFCGNQKLDPKNKYLIHMKLVKKCPIQKVRV